jgi:hypothetical protein
MPQEQGPSYVWGVALDEFKRMQPDVKTVGRQPKKFSKRQLYAMLADAVGNTG